MPKYTIDLSDVQASRLAGQAECDSRRPHQQVKYYVVEGIEDSGRPKPSGPTNIQIMDSLQAVASQVEKLTLAILKEAR